MRTAYSGALKQDPDLISRALKGLSKKESFTLLLLGLVAVGFIVNDIYPDGVTDEGVRKLARKIVDEESPWMDVGDIDTVSTFLKVAASGDSALAKLGMENITGLTIVCGAHLLTYYRLENQHWYEYLDEIFTILEAAPDVT